MVRVPLPEVAEQRVLPAGAVGAVQAGEGLLARVGVDVVLEVLAAVLPGEGPPAQRADKGGGLAGVGVSPPKGCGGGDTRLLQHTQDSP